MSRAPMRVTCIGANRSGSFEEEDKKLKEGKRPRTLHMCQVFLCKKTCTYACPFSATKKKYKNKKKEIISIKNELLAKIECSVKNEFQIILRDKRNHLEP